MDHTPATALHNRGEVRGLMNNGNFSVTFVPLIAVMATMVPRFLTRIKQMRPTQTVQGRNFMSLRDARYLFKEAIDNELCSDKYIRDYETLSTNPHIFYSCKIKGHLRNCNSKQGNNFISFSQEDEMFSTRKDSHENFLIGRVSGNRGCVYMKLYHCPSNHVVTDHKVTSTTNHCLQKQHHNQTEPERRSNQQIN